MTRPAASWSMAHRWDTLVADRARSLLTATLAALGIAVLAVILLAGAGYPSLLWALVPIVLWALIARQAANVALSPVLIVSGVTIVFGVVGDLIYQRGTPDTPGGVVPINDGTVSATFHVYMTTAVALLLGAVVFALINRSTPIVPGGQPKLTQRERPEGLLWLVTLIALILASLDPGSLLHRATYLRGSAGSISTGTTGLLAIGAVAILGFLAGSSGPVGRFFARLFALVFLLILFSLGTREFAVAPLIFFASGYAAKRSNRWLTGLIVTGVLAIYLVPIPLYLRGLSDQGLIPYLHALPAYVSGASTSSGVGGAVANAVGAFPIVDRTAFDPSIVTWHTLSIELNPAPGSAAGWYAISPLLRLNLYVPFSAIGEVRHVGWGAVFIVWGAIGFVLAYLERRFVFWMRAGNRVVALAIFSTSALFALLIEQYNMRSASRMLYYAVVIDLVARLLLLVRARQASKPPSQAGSRLRSAELHR